MDWIACSDAASLSSMKRVSVLQPIVSFFWLTSINLIPSRRQELLFMCVFWALKLLKPDCSLHYLLGTERQADLSSDYLVNSKHLAASEPDTDIIYGLNLWQAMLPTGCFPALI